MAGFTLGGGDQAGVLDLENNASTALALSASAAQTAALSEGTYAVWCDAASDMFIRVAPIATGVTTGNGMIIRSGQTNLVRVRDQSKIGAIVASGTPNLRYHKVG